jgi:hypothetical protein
MESLTSDDETKTINNTDSDFLSYLNQFINQELLILERNDFSYKNKERYLIFKQAFSKVINQKNRII